MVNTLLPSRNEFVPDLLRLADAIKKIDRISDTELERASDGGRGLIARLRKGEGVNYDTLQRFSAWLNDRKTELEAAGATIVVAADCSTESLN